MACGSCAKISRRLAAICVANEGLRSVVVYNINL